MATKRAGSKPTARSRGSADKTVTVDFGEIEGRDGKKGSGRSAHVDPGDYLVQCTKAELTRSGGEKKTPEIKATYKIIKGKFKGKTIIDDLYLTEGALWRLRVTLEGMGINVPSSKVKVDPKKMVGKQLGVSIDDDEYDGKIRSRVIDSFLPSELDDEAEDLDEEDEDEDYDEEDEDEEDDEDEDEEEEEDEDLDEIDL